VSDDPSSEQGRLNPASFSRIGVEMPIWWRVGIVVIQKEERTEEEKKISCDFYLSRCKNCISVVYKCFYEERYNGSRVIMLRFRLSHTFGCIAS
jgi:hypothetical protein